jgi:hypothetical protein
MKVKLKSQSVTIQATRSAVFKLIGSFGDAELGERSTDSAPNAEEGKTLIERDGNRLLMEFRSRTAPRCTEPWNSASPSGTLKGR